MNFNQAPNFSGMSKEELINTAGKYHKNWRLQSKKSKLYEEIIASLTDETVDKFIIQNEDDKSLQMDEEKISAFKAATDIRSVLAKLKTVAEASQSKVRELEQSVSYLQRELDAERMRSKATIKTLQEQLSRIKDDDPIERRTQAFRDLFIKRKPIPIKDVQQASNNQSIIMSKLFSSEYLSSTRDGKDELFQEQQEIEFNIIEQCLDLLRTQFQDLPGGVERLEQTSIMLDINPILVFIIESRNRLSYVIGEKHFTRYLTDHIKELAEILDIFNSKIRGSDISEINIPLSPYEEGLLEYKDRGQNYINTYERAIDLQKRLLIFSKMSNKITPFRGLDEFPTCVLFNQLEDVVKTMLITSKPINNLVFVKLKDSGPNPFSYYQLEEIAEDKRLWKLDAHFLFVVRLFMDKYARLATDVFRNFYRDVFGNNDYINKFEDVMETKGIVRWKQMKVLWENIQIVADEYLIGEIMRKVIRTHAPLYPKEGIDILQSDKDVGDATAEFKRIRERWRHGLPASDEEPEEHMYNCFDKYKNWDHEATKQKYYQRWKRWLIQEKYVNS